MTEFFKIHLQKGNLSENTITSYLWTADYYLVHYGKVDKENLLAYKDYLLEHFKPKNRKPTDTSSQQVP